MSTVIKNADDTYQPVDFERAKRLLPGIQREVVQTAAHDLRRCGVPIRWHKSQWIVEGLSAALIDKFCSRTRQILAAGLKHNRCSYGAAKAIDARLSVLQPQWRAALTADELRALDGIAARLHPPEPTQTNVDAVLRVAVEAALADELWVCTDDLVAAIAPE